MYPGKLLAYNCSPSFNWRKKLAPDAIAEFQATIARMGYKFQFVTLAGFHAVNLSMYQLARAYSEAGMSAYSELQEEEFRAEEGGYAAVKHQSFVGAGYYDDVSQDLSGGLTTTLAMEVTTEAEQFQERPKNRTDAASRSGPPRSATSKAN